jgi:hypothetical protein
VLVSGDEDFVYAVNAVAYKGCRVEVAGFRSNTAPKLIDVADYFIDLGEIAEKVRKETTHGHRYYDNHTHDDAANNFQPRQTEPPQSSDMGAPSEETTRLASSLASPIEDESHAQPDPQSDFIRVTDDH